MRAPIAILAILVVLATTFAPHTHGGTLGAHACIACVTSGCDEARCDTPTPAPPAPIATVPRIDARPSPIGGAPLGAVPGQSPPAVS